MKNLKALCILLLGSLLLTGCASPLSKAFVRTAVATSVSIQAEKHPKSVPYLKATTLVICKTAAGTNIEPSVVVAILEASEASKLKTPEGVLIVNGVLSLYSALYEEYWKDPEDLPQVRSYLEAVCEGMVIALPPMNSRMKALVVPPHIQ